METVYSLRELQDTYKLAGRFIGAHVLHKYLIGMEAEMGHHNVGGLSNVE